MSKSLDITSSMLRGSGFRALHAGDDYSLTITVKQNGTALDLTSASVWFTVKKREREKDSSADLQLTVGSGITLTSPTSGVLSIDFTSAQTSSLSGKWKYDLQVKLQSGKVITVLVGTIEFLPNTTVSTT